MLALALLFQSCPAAEAQSEITCPPVEVREGATTLTVGPESGETSPMTVKYQGTFTRTARECAQSGDSMVMKVGIQGRIVVGPAGGPGQVGVPIRIAVVQDTPGGSRPIFTKLIRMAVTIGQGQGSATFAHVEEALTFPIPSPQTVLDDYVVYVGFDPLAAKAQDKPAPKRHEKTK